MSDTIDGERRIQRVQVPEGSDLAWEWATSLPYRCLADVDRAQVMPAPPRGEHAFTEHSFNQSLAYYTALRSFLTYSFGWSRHDKGLNWWRQRDFAALDDRLALIRATWHTDGTLFGYFAWTTTVDPNIAITPLRPWMTAPDLRPLQLEDRELEEVRDALGRPPWTGGFDPMHLSSGDHGGAPSGSSVYGGGEEWPMTQSTLVVRDETDRTALFVAESVRGWYADLARMAGELPPLPGGRSWRVDVYVREIGFLGTYRRSRDTGLWFSGRHELHDAGN